MSDAEIRTIVLEALRHVAPELDPSALDATRPVREQVDIDSIDFLRVLAELKQKLGVDVPEADYDKVRTLDETVAYLGARAATV